MQKALVIVLALAANLAIQWYAHRSGQFGNAGKLFGVSYDSALASSAVFALRFVWLLLLINIATALASKIGQNAFDSFVVFMLLFIAMAPLSTLLYNAVVTKEPINALHIAGIVLVFLGAAAIAANKEILAFLSK